jgi:hypothetical protein
MRTFGLTQLLILPDHHFPRDPLQPFFDTHFRDYLLIFFDASIFADRISSTPTLFK